MPAVTPQPGTERPAPTLARLLDVAELGLELHHGSPETPYRAVRHLDRGADLPWLAAGDLLIAEAANDGKRRPDAALERGAAALIYLLDPQRRSVPEALLARCAELNVALLSAPPATPPERVEEAALAVLVQKGGLDRLAAVQRYLLTTLTGPKPERDILAAVNRLSGASLALFSPWGESVARAGPKFTRLSRAEIESLSEGYLRLPSGTALAVAEVNARGRRRGLLVSFDNDEVDLAWLELTRGLLLTAALQRSAEAQEDRGRKGALLAEWLAGPQAAEMLLPRLRSAGLDVDNEYVVVVAEVATPAAPGKSGAGLRQRLLERLREAADEFFLASGTGALSASRADHDIWVYASGAPRTLAEPLLRALQPAAEEAGTRYPVRLGLSLPRHDLSGVADAYHQAMLSLKSVPGPAGLAWFDQFDPVYWVLKQQPSGNLATVRDRLVGRVKESDDGKLWRTLSAYLRAPNDLNALARELHIHVNTLRYRLKRIEELIAAPLNEPETLAKLYLAQQMDAMLERDEGLGVGG